MHSDRAAHDDCDPPPTATREQQSEVPQTERLADHDVDVVEPTGPIERSVAKLKDMTRF